MSLNVTTGIKITTPADWELRGAESWGARLASSPTQAVDWTQDIAGMPRTMLLKGSQPYVDLLEEPPNHYSAPHYHTETEVLIVLRGKMFFNGQWCDVGSVIIVPANEEYWHSTDDVGCLVAVIRPAERGLLVHGADARAAHA